MNQTKRIVRKDTSPARFAQLEELKRRRKAERMQRQLAAPLKQPFRATLDQLLAEVTRQSMAGVMPTMAAFDYAKPAGWETASALCERMGMTWAEIAALAGLSVRDASQLNNIVHERVWKE